MDTVDNNSTWTFLTNHSHVLLCLAGNPEMRIRSIAEKVGITERAVHKIMGDLDEAGYLIRNRVGRRNTYRIKTSKHLRHQIEKHKKIADLISFVFGLDQKAR